MIDPDNPELPDPVLPPTYRIILPDDQDTPALTFI
jgi:hypothetical protein